MQHSTSAVQDIPRYLDILIRPKPRKTKKRRNAGLQMSLSKGMGLDSPIRKENWNLEGTGRNWEAELEPDLEKKKKKI